MFEAEFGELRQWLSKSSGFGTSAEETHIRQLTKLFHVLTQDAQCAPQIILFN